MCRGQYPHQYGSLNRQKCEDGKVMGNVAVKNWAVQLLRQGNEAFLLQPTNHIVGWRSRFKSYVCISIKNGVFVMVENSCKSFEDGER